jgi:hypothetical protein
MDGGRRLAREKGPARQSQATHGGIRVKSKLIIGMVAGAALTAIAAFAPGVASAAKFNTSTTFAITPGGKSFTGKVRSPKSSCERSRTVRLQRKLAGQSKFANIGSDKTNRQGKWTVATSPRNGAQYRAVVASKKVRRNTCKAAASRALTARQTTSTIAINASANAFGGKVRATSPCVSGRTVRLQRKNPGASSFANVGSADTTTSNGTWSIATSPVNNAQYRGSIAAKNAGANACMAAFSKVTTARASNVTIQQGGSTNFHGSVNSSSACESNRTVTLQRRGIYETAFHNIGADATNASGAWLVPTAVQSGASYRASVSAKQVGSSSCLDDLSPVRVAS